MPTYQFQCDPELKGCGEVMEVFCLYSKLAELTPKSCPKCKKRKAIKQLLGNPVLSIPSTLGSLAEKNSDKMSADEKHYIISKQNEYKKGGTDWIPTDNGMVHKNDQR